MNVLKKDNTKLKEELQRSYQVINQVDRRVNDVQEANARIGSLLKKFEYENERLQKKIQQCCAEKKQTITQFNHEIQRPNKKLNK